MKKYQWALVVCVLMWIAMSTRAQAQDWGVGIRLGDLSGITVKKHMEGKALELSIGRTHMFPGRYYEKHFDYWYKDKKYGYDDFRYIGYTNSTPIGIQFHYLIQKGIGQVLNESTSGLEWYYGFGGQLRYQTYTYRYWYKYPGTDWIEENGEQVTDIDLGIDGVLGLEYTFSKAPISVFLDVTLFMEVIDNPFLFWGQGGLGARYRF